MVYATFAALAQTVKQGRRIFKPTKSAIQLTDSAAERIKTLLQTRQKVKGSFRLLFLMVLEGISETGCETKRMQWIDVYAQLCRRSFEVR